GVQVGDLAGDHAGVRVDEDLRRVRSHAVPRPVRTVHAVAVALPRAHPFDVAVPHPEGALGELDPLLAPRPLVAVDEAHLDGIRAGRGDSEADTAVVGMGTQREDRHDRRGYAPWLRPDQALSPCPPRVILRIRSSGCPGSPSGGGRPPCCATWTGPSSSTSGGSSSDPTAPARPRSCAWPPPSCTRRRAPCTCSANSWAA